MVHKGQDIRAELEGHWHETWNYLYTLRRSGVFIVNFEHISRLVLVFSLSTLSG